MFREPSQILRGTCIQWACVFQGKRVVWVLMGMILSEKASREPPETEELLRESEKRDPIQRGETGNTAPQAQSREGGERP